MHEEDILFRRRLNIALFIAIIGFIVMSSSVLLREPTVNPNESENNAIAGVLAGIGAGMSFGVIGAILDIFTRGCDANLKKAFIYGAELGGIFSVSMGIGMIGIIHNVLEFAALILALFILFVIPWGILGIVSAKLRKKISGLFVSVSMGTFIGLFVGYGTGYLEGAGYGFFIGFIISVIVLLYFERYLYVFGADIIKTYEDIKNKNKELNNRLFRLINKANRLDLKISFIMRNTKKYKLTAEDMMKIKEYKVKINMYIKTLSNFHRNISKIDDKALKKIDSIEEFVSEVSAYIENITDFSEKHDEVLKWLMDINAIDRHEKLDKDAQSRLKRLYDIWTSLKKDIEVEKRIDDLEIEIKTIEQLINRYSELMSHDTSAGKRAYDRKKNLEDKLKMKENEMTKLINLKEERDRSINEIEDEARLIVLEGISGKYAQFSEKTVSEAENLLKSIKDILETIEVSMCEFMGYEILSKEYRGGFSDIYKVKKDDGYYAMKAPKNADICGNETIKMKEEEIEDFKREGEIWKSLSDIKGVVNLFEYKAYPFPWFVMEYMDDGNLRDRICEGKLDVKTSIIYAIKLLETLSEIHERNIFHRDLKPENILFNKKGEMKITDFGLSKVINSTKISSGYKGTLDYSAPEQFDPTIYGNPDWRTDIYQIGDILYEMLSGKPPFDGSTSEMVGKIMSSTPEPLSKVNHKISKEIESIVAKALEKNKEDRWQSAMEFRRALEDAHV